MFERVNLNDPNDADKIAQFRRMALPMLDQQLRSVISTIWMALPPERQTVEEVEKEFRRVADRALANLREDIAAFGLPENPGEKNSSV